MSDEKEKLKKIVDIAEELLIDNEKIDYLVQQLTMETLGDSLNYEGLTVDACKDLYNRQMKEIAILTDIILDYSKQSLEKCKGIIDIAYVGHKE